MPHIVLNGDVTAQMVFDWLAPFTLHDKKMLLRTLKKYIDEEENSVLIEALAIEDGKKSSFLVLLGNRENGLVIRIYPELVVEKTDGVKMILAQIAKQLLEKYPDLKIGKTNLQDFI